MQKSIRSEGLWSSQTATTIGFGPEAPKEQKLSRRWAVGRVSRALDGGKGGHVSMSRCLRFLQRHWIINRLRVCDQALNPV